MAYHSNIRTIQDTVITGCILTNTVPMFHIKGCGGVFQPKWENVYNRYFNIYIIYIYDYVPVTYKFQY